MMMPTQCSKREMPTSPASSVPAVETENRPSNEPGTSRLPDSENNPVTQLGEVREEQPVQDEDANMMFPTSGEVILAKAIEFYPEKPPSTEELRMLFRNRRAEKFGPEELPCKWMFPWTPGAKPLDSKAALERRSSSKLLPREKLLIRLPSEFEMIRSRERVGYFAMLKIRNLSPHFITYRVRASVEDRYLLTPPMGCLEVDGVAKVYIETDRSLGISPKENLTGDTFLVDVFPLVAGIVNMPSLFIFWKLKSIKGKIPYRYPIEPVFVVERKRKEKSAKKRGSAKMLEEHPSFVALVDNDSGVAEMESEVMELETEVMDPEGEVNPDLNVADGICEAREEFSRTKWLKDHLWFPLLLGVVSCGFVAFFTLKEAYY